MESSPHEPEAAPNVPPVDFIRQMNALMRMREEHVNNLRARGLVAKAYSVLPEHKRTTLKGAVVEPCVYSRPLRILDKGQYIVVPDRYEEGVCFKVTRVMNGGNLQRQKIFTAVSHFEQGMVVPHGRKPGVFTQDDANMIHHCVTQLQRARDAEGGLLPNLSLDCTEINDGSYYEG